ncbi:MAG: type I-B CRISPR-associated protein Cas7/Cst2/DevR [Planctomycetaceae bacterium]|nr:type I-B CRISPR-associated protein Cas7/Cst2/DevR [Planctomycetaceae bacterium]
MTLHLFGTILTHRGIASNNRGEVEAGTVSTLQKVIRYGELYSTVSGEAIRYALREVWPHNDAHAIPTDHLNRPVPMDEKGWKDPTFAEGWDKYVDNDVLGYMLETNSRRGVLEVGRAVSTNPWPGTVTNHFASVGAQPRRNESKGNPNPIPYTVEVHDTHYQYTFAFTPDALKKEKLDRTKKTLMALCNLRRVGGNHSRFFYDFAPQMVVLRATHDPAPRIMNCFVEDEERGAISLKPLIHRMTCDDGDQADVRDVRDVRPDEIIIGGVPAEHPIHERKDVKRILIDDKVRQDLTIKQSVKAAFWHLLDRLVENDEKVVLKPRQDNSNHGETSHD